MPSDADEIAPGYRTDRVLSTGVTRCIGPDGRMWVLKPVPADCLHGGGLHPAIRERLAKVCQVPHARLATLAGVVRGTDGVTAYLVWAHVDGEPIDRATHSRERFPAVARELASAVELLHARGLVHGGLTASNVILSPAGDVWLTHVSPYLWDDPAVDVQAVVELLRPITAALGFPPPDVPEPTTAALHDLANRWSSAPDPADPGDGRRFRARAIAVAVLLAGAAVASAVAIRSWVARPVGDAATSAVIPLVNPGR